MDRSRLSRLGPYLCIGILVQLIYVATLAPSLTWSHWGSDGGDLVTAAVTGRVSHPPGSPVYHLLSRLWVGSVPGDPAQALNWFSALMATGSVLLVAAALRRRGLGWATAAPAALTLAFAPWFWSQAIITEVYTTGALFGSAAIYLNEARPAGAWRGSLLVGLALGLGMSVHFTVGVLLVYVLASGKHAWGALGAGLSVGLIPYLLLPASGPWPQPWGDLRSFGGWWEFVSARLYWGNAFALPLSSWPRRTLAWWVLASRQFTPFGLLLACLGGGRLWRQDRRRAWGVAVTGSAITLYALGYNTPDSWVYLVACLPLAAMMVAEGLDWVTQTRISPWWALALPLALLLLNWQALDLRHDRDVSTWLDHAFEQIPPGAVVVSHADRHTFALWYATDALARREDVLVVDQRLWGYVPYVEYLRGRAGADALGLESPAQGRPVSQGRPVCDIGEEGEVVCR